MRAHVADDEISPRLGERERLSAVLSACHREERGHRRIDTLRHDVLIKIDEQASARESRLLDLGQRRSRVVYPWSVEARDDEVHRRRNENDRAILQSSRLADGDLELLREDVVIWRVARR